MDKATVYQLKSYLKAKNQTCSGNKAELMNRIQEFITAEELETDEVILEILAFNRTHVEEGTDGTLKPIDSVSQVGDSDIGNQLGKVIAKRASLDIKLQKLKRKQELEMEMHRLKLEQDRLELETELESAIAEFNSLSKFDNNVNGNVENDPRDCRSTHQNNSDSQQTNRDMVATLMTKNMMPVHVIHKFNGQLDKYFEFIRDFDMLIDSKHVSDSERLQYLKQYTEGKPHNIVRMCLNLDTNEGYQRARSELNKRYGNKERIALMHIDKVLAWPEIKEENVEALDDFIVELNSCISAISGINYGISELQNLRTLRQLVEKLPRHLQDRWRRLVDEVAESGKLVDIKDLVRFLEKEVRILSNPTFGRSSKGGFRDKKVEANTWSSNRKTNYKKGIEPYDGRVHVNVTQKARVSCWLCQEEHVIDVCPELRWLSYEEKLNRAYNLELCFKCLRKGHKAFQCRVIRTCEQCGGSHLTIMHRMNKNFKVEGSKEVTANPAVTNEVDDSRIQVLSSQLKDSVGDTTAIPVQVELNGKVVTTRCYIDNGSSVTFCTKNLLQKLGMTDMNYQSTTLQVSTIVGTRGMSCLNVEGMSVADIEGNNQIRLPPVFAVNKLPLNHSHNIRKNDIERWKHLMKLEFDHSQGEIEIMIGINVPEASEPWEVVHAEKPGDPEFVDSSLNSVEPSIEDRRWLQFVESGCRQMNNGKYEIPLPMTDKPRIVPNSEPMAVKRLQQLKRKFKDHEYYKQYKQFMTNLLEKGYAEEVPKYEVSNQQAWYVPHFGVQHPTKRDKVRVVFDCAARVNDLSLNDLLRQGPDINNLLLGVLLRFRLGLYACTADIETMYYQVKVPEDDRNYLRFLWWKDGHIGSEIVKLRMTSHPFGASCSPSIANYALKRVVQDHGSQFHKSVSEIVLNNFYVDDMLVSSDDINELIDNCNNVIDLCSKGGFNLTKFNSNSREVLKNILKDKCSDNIEKFIEDEEVVQKTLGLNWSLGKDEMSISINIDEIPRTKRELLAVIGKIYDPLGMVAPVVLEGRVLLQELFRNGIGWDCTLSEKDQGLINVWMSRVNKLKLYSIDRCTKKGITSKVEAIECHIFCDSSEIAYGSVVYLRYKHIDGTIQCSFMLGKAKVAPLKSITIPRLELVAATLAIKLKCVIVRELPLKLTQIYIWTDSTTVLKYLHNDHLRFKTFVANRVSQIRENSEDVCWMYVSSRDNPADDVTRMRQTSRWSEGPAFLSQNEEIWPVQQQINKEDFSNLEIKRVMKVEVKPIQGHTVDVMSRLVCHYSSWFKLLRACSYLILFVRHLQRKGVSIIELNVQLMEVAEERVIKFVQNCYFAKEIVCLSKNDPINLSSSIRKLKPMLLNGILRVGGRLINLELPLDMKHPVILPHEHHVTSLIIQHYHMKVGHMGRQAVLNQLRQKYWVIKGNSAVRKVLSKCVSCRRFKSSTITQEMAALPVDRANVNQKPFFVTGVDCFGPFFVKRARSRVKRYGIIFTCLSIRAIHLEILHDLTAESMINAFTRFMSRRGTVSKLISDHGTNFIGANKVLKDNLIMRHIGNELTKRGVDWVFTPPGGSHYGGVFERMIGLVRRVLEVVIGSQTLSDDSLSTFFCEVESIINSRPLTVVSNDVNDLCPITPNSLLNLDNYVVTLDGGEMICESRRK
ncbi:uncharacterized protein LOC143036654 [Oratosquilla oratoria]|uniref:uncharacterized protein LOC143036654 n=1 Tax=Oratosquilla oratoria TaxID=337810 RepID=UPI003F76915E